MIVTKFYLPFMLIAAVLAPPPSAYAQNSRSDPDPRWLDRLDAVDRKLLQEWVGYAAPEFPAELTWASGQPLTWQDMRGTVVVLQSWTNRRSSGRSAATRVERLAQERPDDDLKVILLHTPEGADRLQRFLERKTMDAAVALDSRGSYCDTLGIYKEPVNVVVDRQGTVRYVGLNQRGLAEAVDQLAAEPFVADHPPAPRPEKETAVEAGQYPPFNPQVGSAQNVQGRQAPSFYVGEWLTAAPESNDKVLVVDFWATWCGPCRASIPHMNQLADRYREEANFVGISSESRSDFEKGCMRHRLSPDSFHYSLALDPARRMSGAIKVRGIPHCVVISRDGIVRWQGHPARLDAETLGRIIAADGGGEKASARRWAQEG